MEELRVSHKMVISESENSEAVEEMKIKDKKLKKAVKKLRSDYKHALWNILDHLEDMHKYTSLLEGLLRGEEYEVKGYKIYEGEMGYGYLERIEKKKVNDQNEPLRDEAK